MLIKSLWKHQMLSQCVASGKLFPVWGEKFSGKDEIDHTYPVLEMHKHAPSVSQLLFYHAGKIVPAHISASWMWEALLENGAL